MRSSAAYYYGWRIVATFALTETISYGVLYYSFSIYIVPFETAFDWTRAEVTGAFSLALLVSGIMAVPVGFWLDRYSSRIVMTVGSVLGTLAFFAFAWVDTLWAMYLIWLVIGVSMAMTFYEPAFIVVAKWFSRRRGTALALITFIAGFASTIFLPLANWLLTTYGRHTSIVILATILALGTIPFHFFVLRRWPEDLGLRPDGESIIPTAVVESPLALTLRTALQDRSFWWLTTGFALASAAGYGIRIHLIPLLLDRGFSPEFAAGAAGMIGAMQVFGRVIYAPVGDRISAKQVVIIVFILQTVALALLRFVVTDIGVWSFILLIGAVNGVMTLARPMMIANTYGTAHYGRISSIVASTQTLAVTAAPYGAGLLYVYSGQSYDYVLLVMIGATVLAIGAITQTTARAKARA